MIRPVSEGSVTRVNVSTNTDLTPNSLPTSVNGTIAPAPVLLAERLAEYFGKTVLHGRFVDCFVALSLFRATRRHKDEDAARGRFGTAETALGAARKARRDAEALDPGDGSLAHRRLVLWEQVSVAGLAADRLEPLFPHDDVSRGCGRSYPILASEAVAESTGRAASAAQGRGRRLAEGAPIVDGEAPKVMEAVLEGDLRHAALSRIRREQCALCGFEAPLPHEAHRAHAVSLREGAREAALADLGGGAEVGAGDRPDRRVEDSGRSGGRWNSFPEEAGIAPIVVDSSHNLNSSPCNSAPSGAFFLM